MTPAWWMVYVAGVVGFFIGWLTASACTLAGRADEAMEDLSWEAELARRVTEADEARKAMAWRN